MLISGPEDLTPPLNLDSGSDQMIWARKKQLIEVAVKQTGSAAAHASLLRAFKWRDGASIGQIKVCPRS